jgi:N-acyl-D-amino-acid deacylase
MLDVHARRVTLSALLLGFAAAACGAACQGRGPESGAGATASASASASATAMPIQGSASAASSPQPGGSSAVPAGSGEPDFVKAAPFTAGAPVELWIRGGEVIDGTGRSRAKADVVVRDGRIVHVGPVADHLQASEIIDATGLVVAPGFIDAHVHTEPDADNEPFVAQGVTTICVGMDGRSASSGSVGAWLGKVDKQQLRLNVVPLAGHADVRTLAGVVGNRKPTAEQLAKMAEVMRKELEDGAFGLSTGLEYAPGLASGLEELVAVAKPVAEHDAVVMSHLRSEDDDQIDAALDELIAQGKGSGARVHVSHLKVVYGHGAARAEKLLARMDAARKDGVRLTADFYPYQASYTGIGIVFPDWANSRPALAKAKESRREELAKFLRERIAKRGGPKATLFGTGAWRGKTLEQAASESGKPFEDLLIDDIGPNGANAAYFVMDEPLQARLLVDRFVMLGSDGSPVGSHPRGYGSFARVLEEYVRKRGLLTLEQAVHKMTGLTAETLGLEQLGRGLVRNGLAADLVVFDPEKVRERTTYTDPNRLAEGVSWVVVNGVAIRAKGAKTSAHPGKALRH